MRDLHREQWTKKEEKKEWRKYQGGRMAGALTCSPSGRTCVAWKKNRWCSLLSYLDKYWWIDKVLALFRSTTWVLVWSVWTLPHRDFKSKGVYPSCIGLIKVYRGMIFSPICLHWCIGIDKCVLGAYQRCIGVPNPNISYGHSIVDRCFGALLFSKLSRSLSLWELI